LPKATGIEKFVKTLESKHACACVIGLGYVGLPLAVEQAQARFRVLGVERNPQRVAQVNRGQNYIADIQDDELKAVVDAGRLSATTDFAPVAEADVVTICVPTPLDKNKMPDTQYIEHVVEASLPHVHAGQLFILESTTYPGTTEEIILPRLEGAGFTVGREVFLAFSPERVDPGNKQYAVRNTPKVVGGVTPRCTEAAKAFYEAFLEAPVFPVSTPRAAEMTKLFENIFRIVNVSLVNELAMLCDRMKIDVWEVIEAAKTKPFGFMPFYPGPGLGGHCIPIDPFYLSWKAKEFDFTTQFVELAGQINDGMPEYVVDQALLLLNCERKPLNGSRVLLLGVAYKKDVSDLRESPALRVARLLVERGAELDYHDPHVPEAEVSGHMRQSVPLTEAQLKASDLVLITTDHSQVDYGLVFEHAPLIYDTRNAMTAFRGERLHRLGEKR